MTTAINRLIHLLSFLVVTFLTLSTPHLQAANHPEPVYRQIVNTFHNKHYYEKGLLASSVTSDALGNRFLETQQTYLLRDIDTGLAVVDENDLEATVFPELVRTDKRFYEGEAIAGKTTHMTYEYDAIGNIVRLFDAADTGANDDVEALIGYFSDLPNYIVGKANSILVNGDGAEFRRRESTIEPGTGNLLQVRRLLANGDTAVTDLDYDGFGNLIQVVGPANLHNERYTLDYAFDTVVNTYVESVTDSFGYQSSATYNLNLWPGRNHHRH